MSWIPFLSHLKLIIWMWRGMVFSNFKNDPYPLATWIWITVLLFQPSFGSTERAIDCPLAFRWWNMTIKVDISWTLRYANFTSPCFSQGKKKLFHVKGVGMKIFLVRPLWDSGFFCTLRVLNRMKPTREEVWQHFEQQGSVAEDTRTPPER